MVDGTLGVCVEPGEKFRPERGMSLCTDRKIAKKGFPGEALLALK